MDALDALLIQAAKTGDLGHVQQYTAQRWMSHRSTATWCMNHACEKGHFRFVLWLHETFKFTSHQMSISNYRAFEGACAGCHMLLARWLLATFGARQSDIYFALHYACQSGHLQVARWLHTTTALASQCVKNDDNCMLRVSCGNGHLRVTSYLYTTHRLNRPDGFVCWSRRTHHTWYWQAEVVAAASQRVPRVVLCDVLRRM